MKEQEPPIRRTAAMPPIRRPRRQQSNLAASPWLMLFLLLAAVFYAVVQLWPIQNTTRTEVKQVPIFDPHAQLRENLRLAISSGDLVLSRDLARKLEAQGGQEPHLLQDLQTLHDQMYQTLLSEFTAAHDDPVMIQELYDRLLVNFPQEKETAVAWSEHLNELEKQKEREIEQAELETRFQQQMEQQDFAAAERTLKKLASLGQDVATKMARIVRTVTFPGGVKMRFRWIPPGSYMRGSPANEALRKEDEGPHQVVISQGFWLGETEVTQAQWQGIMNHNPSFFKGKQRPVEQVSFVLAQTFFTFCNSDGQNLRLPTEAEWEYACRAGSTTPFHTGKTLTDDQANFDASEPYNTQKKGNYRGETTHVGSFPANRWGLYDMHGNVWEWCSDKYGFYPTIKVTDPSGNPTFKQVPRVLRGGGWADYAQVCRSASRFKAPAQAAGHNIGLRVVWVP